MVSFPKWKDRLINWIGNKDLSVCCLQETDVMINDRDHRKVKEHKNIFNTDGFKKQSSVAMLISEKMFQTKGSQNGKLLH